jgi:hypothetical protein
MFIFAETNESAIWTTRNENTVAFAQEQGGKP